MKQPLKEQLIRIGGGHLLNEGPMAVTEYSNELGEYIRNSKPRIKNLKFSIDRQSGAWEWESGDISIYATWGWEGKKEVAIEDDTGKVVKTLKYNHTGDLKKDAEWYISNMKRYLPGIVKDIE